MFVELLFPSFALVSFLPFGFRIEFFGSCSDFSSRSFFPGVFLIHTPCVQEDHGPDWQLGPDRFMSRKRAYLDDFLFLPPLSNSPLYY